MVIVLAKKEGVSRKLVEARKAHEWLSHRPRVLLENMGKWICLSTDRVLGIGSTFNEALKISPKKPALVLKVPSYAAAYAIQHRVR